MDKLWTWLIGLAAAAAAAGTIFFQNNEIVSLKEIKSLNEKKIEELEAKVKIGITERERITATLKEYQNKKAEIEVKYITREVPVFREIVKTIPPETVETTAKEEINEVYSSITSRATDFSLRNNQD